jgi:2-oxoglutarate ferredoxin oxidoreductase subunit delta
MARVRILQKFCKSCELCIVACPHGVLAMTEEIGRRGKRVLTVVAEAKCTACLRCATMCPDAAIEVEADEPAKATSA